MSENSLCNDVYDIGSTGYRLHDKILIDANVLYFCYYDRFGQLEILGDKTAKDYQKKEYPNFLSKTLSKKVKFYIHRITLLEFINTIEIAELEILTGNKNARTFRKDIRKRQSEDYRVIQGKIATYLHAIKKTFNFINVNKSIDVFLFDFLFNWQDTLTDPADAMIVSEAKNIGITSVLSDDADFVTLKDIYLYTANEKALDSFNK